MQKLFPISPAKTGSNQAQKLQQFCFWMSRRQTKHFTFIFISWEEEEMGEGEEDDHRETGWWETALTSRFDTP